MVLANALRVGELVEGIKADLAGEHSRSGNIDTDGFLVRVKSFPLVEAVRVEFRHACRNLNLFGGPNFVESLAKKLAVNAFNKVIEVRLDCFALR